jgi:2-alkenal reductase
MGSSETKRVLAIGAIGAAILLLLIGTLAVLVVDLKRDSVSLVISEDRRPLPAAVVGDIDAELVADRTSSGVVTLQVGFRDAPEVGSGSGFIIDKQGFLVTNLHVISKQRESGQWVQADDIWVEFAGGARSTATLIGYDPGSDLALLRSADLPADSEPLVLGDSNLVRVGQPVVAIGAPFGNSGSVSQGIVSALDRSIEGLQGSFRIVGVLQTDVLVNTGNSGGPLLDAAGRVIGINTQIQSRSRVNEGVAFAIPINRLKQILPRLRGGGELKSPYVGVSAITITPSMADALGLPRRHGVLLQAVFDGSPAARAGLRGAEGRRDYFGQTVGTGGDIILAVDGKQVATMSEFSSLIDGLAVDQEIVLDILRDEEEIKVPLRLGLRPTKPAE